MIKFEHIEVVGWEPAIRGARNPMNSWGRMDSKFDEGYDCSGIGCSCCENIDYCGDKGIIGPNDYDLMKRLRNAGTDHRKWMRMVVVYVDITAPLYWWKEFDTYKVGTVVNSCSTMHKIHAKEFTLEDFSCEHLFTYFDASENDCLINIDDDEFDLPPLDVLKVTINMLNKAREKFLETKDKKFWYQMIQLLPTSYNQKRTVMLNYEVLANMYHARKNHKLDEWVEHKTTEPDTLENKVVRYPGFCDWIKTLPYSEFITGEFEDKPTWKPAPEEVITAKEINEVCKDKE